MPCFEGFPIHRVYLSLIVLQLQPKILPKMLLLGHKRHPPPQQHLAYYGLLVGEGGKKTMLH